MHKKNITLLILTVFVFLTLFSAPPFLSKVEAQNTGSLRLTTTAGFSFAKDLMQGDTDPDVQKLQIILNSSSDTVVALSGAGSPGQESTYFGALTKTAVIKFQEKYRSEILTPSGLTAGNGIVGRATRTKLNLLLGVTTPTLASVGMPQSRAGSASAAPTIITTSQPNMSTCQFVELLINIGAIAPNKTNSARLALGCPTAQPVISQPVQPSSAVCSFVELLINTGIITPNLASRARSALRCSANTNPSVDVQANGSDGPITVSPGTQIRLSWTSANTSSCSDGVTALSVSGSAYFIANTSQNYPVICNGNNGRNVMDSVTVNVSSNNQASSSIQILSLNIIPGYNSATFGAVTNVPTKMFITYTNDSQATSSANVFESTTTATTHSDNIANLLPNTAYYTRVAFVDTVSGQTVTEDLTFYTLANFGQPSSPYSVHATSSYNPSNFAWSTTTPANFSFSTTSPYTLTFASSTLGSTTSTTSQELDIDQVLIESDGLDCLSPVRNFSYNTVSLIKNNVERYVWVQGESQFFDNTGGALLGSMMSSGNSSSTNTTDASFNATYYLPETGQVLSLVLGAKIKCLVYGDNKEILRAYLTVQGKGWVKEQDANNANSGGNSGGFGGSSGGNSGGF